MSKDVLKKIIKKKIEKVNLLKKTISLNALNEQIDQNKTFINFKDKIQNNINNNKISLIAEIKKASPSAGTIINDYNPIEIAKIFNSFLSKTPTTCLSTRAGLLKGPIILKIVLLPIFFLVGPTYLIALW